MSRLNQNEHIYFIVNTFSIEGFYNGDPVAVIINGHLYSDEEKQNIAVEFGFSNTVFYFPIDSEYPYFQTRIFTPHGETTFHETGLIAAGAVLKQITPHMENVPFVVCCNEEEFTMTYREERGATVFNIPSALLPAGDTLSLDESASLLSIKISEIQKNVPSVVTGNETGLYLPVPVMNAGVLDSITVDPGRVRELVKKYGDFRLVPFTMKPRDKTHDYAMRIFDSVRGMQELPSDGHAAVALGSYLKNNNVFKGKQFSVTIEQGYTFNRPSLVHMAGNKDDDNSELLVGGIVKIWSKGVMY
jgi:trans-2,3-dihydro-3-hydroxyanthranilate isomerase